MGPCNGPLGDSDLAEINPPNLSRSPFGDMGLAFRKGTPAQQKSMDVPGWGPKDPSEADHSVSFCPIFLAKTQTAWIIVRTSIGPEYSCHRSPYVCPQLALFFLTLVVARVMLQVPSRKELYLGAELSTPNFAQYVPLYIRGPEDSRHKNQMKGRTAFLE